MKSKTVDVWLGVGAFIAMGTWSPDGAAQDTQARLWAATCAACHGTEGRGAAAMPPLAGRPKGDLLKALLDFKADKRPATVMHQHAKGYTDQELDRIAEYFSKVKP